MPPTVIPSAASAGRSSRFQSRDCSADSSRTRSRMRASACCGVSPSAERTVTPGLRLPEQAGDPHLEELVEVRGEDRAELHALEKGQRLVRRELENARVELEVRELAVEERLERLGADSRRHRCILYRQRAPWGEHPVKCYAKCAERGRPRRAPFGVAPCDPAARQVVGRSRKR